MGVARRERAAEDLRCHGIRGGLSVPLRAVRADPMAVYLLGGGAGHIAVSASHGRCVLGSYSDGMPPSHAALEVEAAAAVLRGE